MKTERMIIVGVSLGKWINNRDLLSGAGWEFGLKVCVLDFSGFSFSY